MREHALAGTLVRRLATHKQRQFADEQAWTRHLECLGIAALAVTPDPVRVATEGALWGAVNTHGFLCEAVVADHDRLAQEPMCIEIRLMRAMVELWCKSYRRAPKSITLDIDDTADIVHGHQQLSLFNAHYDERCFLPIHVYDADTGHCVLTILRPGKRQMARK